MNPAFPEAIETLLKRRSVVAKNLTEPGPKDHELDMILKSRGARAGPWESLAPWRLQVLDKQAQASLGDILAKVYASRQCRCTR